MNATMLVPLFCLLVGLVLHLPPWQNGKIVRLGEIAIAVGLFWLVALFHGAALRF